MKQATLNKIIEIVRCLSEDGAISVPTNSTSSTPGKPGFSNAANPGGPVAGIDKPVGRRKKYASLGPGSRTPWMQKRNPPEM